MVRRWVLISLSLLKTLSSFATVTGAVSSNLYVLFVNGNVPFISYEKIAASASDLKFFLVISEYLRKFSISEINAKEAIDILSGKSLTS